MITERKRPSVDCWALLGLTVRVRVPGRLGELFALRVERIKLREEEEGRKRYDIKGDGRRVTLTEGELGSLWETGGTAFRNEPGSGLRGGWLEARLTMEGQP